MGRNAQLIRQWAILKQIETNRWTTISDLADSHIVSTKTIRRDLAALMEAGFPLYDERYDGKVYWRLNEEYKGLTLANLSLSETAALYFSKKLVVNLAAPPFSSDIASAFKKIESALPERNIQFLDSLDSMISVRADAPKDLDEHKHTTRTLLEAIAEGHRVKMRYYSVHSQKRKEYLIDPYRLMYFRGGLYLFGYVAEYKQIRTFAIERIESVEKLHDAFEQPKDFSVETYLESSFGMVKEDPFDVEVIFDSEIAEYVRSRVWHPSQQCREIDHGRIPMKLHVGGEFELVTWILGFGASAHVVGPEHLRQRVQDELKRALDSYSKDGKEVTVAPERNPASLKRERPLRDTKIMWYESILEVIGNTPMVRLSRVCHGLKPTLLAKLEYLNPGGSVKDRIGIMMLEAAEREGRIKPGGTIIEGTSGNTGMGLALAAAIKGYRCIFTMPDKMSQEKIDALRALGAEVIVTPTQVDHHDPRSYHSVAERLSREIPNSVFPNQYQNPANADAHYQTTGPEIWEQTEGKITHVVIGVGTGGTITGVARYLKEKNPAIRVIGADPQGSIFAEMFNTGCKPLPQPYKVEGIGQDEMPGNMDFSVIDEIHAVTDKDAFTLTRSLARSEGIFSGGSSGAALHVALKVAEGLTETDMIVVIIPDSGTRYLSKIYNDNWMKENQFLAPVVHVRAGQVVRDKARRTKELVSIPLGITVEDAVTLMREHDISQVPMIEGGGVVGSISEARILDILVSDPGARLKPVVEYMEKPFPVVDENASLNEVAERMDRETPAILVRQKEGGFDIITKSDLIFFLTRKEGGKG